MTTKLQYAILGAASLITGKVLLDRQPKGRQAVCDRCREDCFGTIMSMFSAENICGDCKDKERGFPEYKAAEAADLLAYADRMENIYGCPPEQAENVRRQARRLLTPPDNEQE
jgi:hypothetical protein